MCKLGQNAPKYLLEDLDQAIEENKMSHELQKIAKDDNHNAMMPLNQLVREPSSYPNPQMQQNEGLQELQILLREYNPGADLLQNAERDEDLVA